MTTESLTMTSTDKLNEVHEILQLFTNEREKILSSKIENEKKIFHAFAFKILTFYSMMDR